MTTTSPCLLEMTGICKTFPGVKALSSVDLTLKAGEVHALMGENGAGKSTLMKCLFGLYQADAGTIKIDGELQAIASPNDAMRHGIAMIHQELHPVRHRSVMENLWLGRFPTKGWGPLQRVDRAEMLRRTEQLFRELKLDIDPHAKIGELSASKIQAVEIARAISLNARVLVMDEPTSCLTGDEVERLFVIIADLKKRGVGIIYISHKMDEILRISDSVTIMRDGVKIGSWPVAELTVDSIITRMVGRDVDRRFPTHCRPRDQLMLKVENLSSANPRSFQNISFDLHRGEILGIGGLVGSQRTELVETLFGLRKRSSGSIRLGDQLMVAKNSRDAIRRKFGLLTEERRATGIFPMLSILENMVIVNPERYRYFGLALSKKRRVAAAQAAMAELHIKAPSLDTPIRNLSGGNQQKVLLARWLLTDPDVLILDEPTRGIDVGAKHEIYNLISQLAEQGKSLIIISSEMPELIGMSDRIMVMCEGHVSGFLNREQMSEDAVMRLAAQFKR